MERRHFIERITKTTALGCTAGLLPSACRKAQSRKITILHTNDVHSHIDPFPKSHSTFPGLGGVARRAARIAQIRNETENVLLLDAGDMFQGTPYFNFYGGELEFTLMSKLQYDAATLGNHDFDNGLEGLLAQLPYAEFPMVSANYDFKNTIMDGHTTPYRIFNKGGMTIGVYGLGIALDGLVTKDLYKETQYLDPYEIAQDMERSLTEDHSCDLVICLSHLGYSYKDENKPDDLKLAAKTSNTHLILGGHTHTFLEKPTIVDNRTGQQVMVNQVGCFGIHLGRVDIQVGPKGKSAAGYAIRI